MSGAGGGHRGALALLLAAVLAAAVAYGGVLLPGPTPTWAPWALAFAAVVSILSLMALGAARDRRLGGLLPVFLVAGLVVGGGFVALLLLPPADPAAPVLILGLPVPAAVLLYGVGLLPTILVPVAYALTFEQTLTDRDLERVREAASPGPGREGPGAEPSDGDGGGA